MDLVRADREPCPERHPGPVSVELNPPGIDGRFLDWLNVCFKSPWSPRMYDWYLRRPLAGQRPDRLVLRESGRVVAGGGMNYRRLRLPGGATARIAVLTAAWTLPEARGRGLYGQVAGALLRRAAERGCALVLAFMTRDNASLRSLQKLGATVVPTTYLSDDGTRAPSERPEEAIEVLPAEASSLARALEETVADDAVRFDYPRSEDWRSQFLDRPHPVEILTVGRCHAVVEPTADADRLQLLIGPAADRRQALAALVARARRRDRRFFAYESRAVGHEIARGIGLSPTDGALTCFVSRDQGTPIDLTGASWEIQSGDRM